MKKYYKWDYEKQYIGSSDVAALILVGYKENEGMCSEILNFGEDNDYEAYIVDEYAEIPERYRLEHEFSSWVKVYDDGGLIKEFNAGSINVYRCGSMGCIIQLEVFTPSEKTILRHIKDEYEQEYKKEELWYAVTSDDYTEWDVGSSDIFEAGKILKEQGSGTLLVIREDLEEKLGGAFCLYAREYRDIFE